MSTYTDSHKKYYKKNKDTIYRKTKKYKAEYNKVYFQTYKLVLAARKKLKEVEVSLGLDTEVKKEI